MSRRKRTCMGAISIFLIIIFVANFMLIGVLVDAGRYRIARATAEMTLDSATGSVMSYYNKMLFDLYGLFATDSLSEANIELLLSDYVSKTLGVTQIDQNTSTQLTDIFRSVLSLNTEESDVQAFDGFDYEFSVKMQDSETLANTDLVENQIIEHMKYRAPMALASESGSFLKKLEGLTSIIDRVEISKEKAELEKSANKEALAADTSGLMERIDQFNQDVLAFTIDPVKMSTTSGDSKDMKDYLREFDDKIMSLANSTELAFADDETKQAEFEKATDDLLEKMKRVQDNAAELNTRANEIVEESEALEERYKAYIALLQAKIDEDPTNENAKTVYLPEIELAQSTCGEMLKNIGLVLMGRKYTSEIYNRILDKLAGLEAVCASVIDIYLNLDENPDAAATLIRTMEEGVGIFGEALKYFILELNDCLNKLNTYAKDFQPVNEIEIKTTPTTDGDVARSEAEKSITDTEDLRNLVKSDLTINYSSSSDDTDWDMPLAGTVDSEQMVSLLSTGLDLLQKLMAQLEDARDNLYINEYAIAYFPNYVQHYAATNSILATQADNTYLVTQDSYYPAYSASQAELEYIISALLPF